MDNEKIGKFIRELREKKGWTQDELAEKLYIRRQSISKWEIGKTCPDSENFKLLSEIFDVSIDELVLGEYISKKDAILKSEELTIKILDDSNAVKSKNKVLRRIIVALVMILILSFAFYYFVMTYNQFKMYYISGESDGLIISDGYLFETNEKIFFQLGKLNVNEDEILSTTVYYVYNEDEVIVYRSDSFDNSYILDNKSYPEYFHSRVSDMINNLYVELKTKDTEYKIKLDYRLDYVNNKFFFEFKKTEIPKKREPKVINKDYQQLYNLLYKNGIQNISFDDDVYQYEVSFIEQLNNVDVLLFNKEELFVWIYSYSFEKDELYMGLLNESYDKCEKDDLCYIEWEKIVNKIIDNLKKE